MATYSTCIAYDDSTYEDHEIEAETDEQAIEQAKKIAQDQYGSCENVRIVDVIREADEEVVAEAIGINEAPDPVLPLLDALEACVHAYLQVDIAKGVHGPAHRAFQLLARHGRDLAGKVDPSKA